MRARTVFRSYKEIRGGRSFQDIYCSFFRIILSPSPLTWPGARVVPLEITAPAIPQGRTEIRKAIPLQDAIVLETTSGYYCNYEGTEEGGGVLIAPELAITLPGCVQCTRPCIFCSSRCHGFGVTNKSISWAHALLAWITKRQYRTWGNCWRCHLMTKAYTADGYMFLLVCPISKKSIAQHTLCTKRTLREDTV